MINTETHHHFQQHYQARFQEQRRQPAVNDIPEMSSMAATAAACLSYCYEPSAIGAAMFIALFGQSAALHTYQAYRARTVLLMPLTAGALCMSDQSSIYLISSNMSQSKPSATYAVSSHMSKLQTSVCPHMQFNMSSFSYHQHSSVQPSTCGSSSSSERPTRKTTLQFAYLDSRRSFSSQIACPSSSSSSVVRFVSQRTISALAIVLS